MTKNNKKMTQNNSRRPKMTKNDAKKLSVTDRRTDGPTDRPTDGAGCRVACTRLKRFLVVQKISEGWFLRSFKISLHKLSACLILFLVVVAGNQRP